MSLEQLESSILSLAPEERKRFAQWFEEHRHDLLQGGGVDDELTADQQAEILRRREQALAHPELLEPWDGTIDRVRQRLHELRRHTNAPEAPMTVAGGKDRPRSHPPVIV